MSAQAKAGLVIFAVVLLAVIFVSTNYPLVRETYFAQQNGEPNKEEFNKAIQRQHEAHVTSGFLVEDVPLSSKAYRFGLKPGDIVTKYNDLPVTNVRTYHAAVDRMVADKAESVTLTVMRSGLPVELKAPPGLLGFSGHTWQPFVDSMLNLLQQNRVDSAASILANADLSVVPEDQVLLTRILLLPDDDSVEKTREEFVRQLMPLIEDHFNHLGVIALDAHRYKVAQMFLLKAIEADPHDVSSRLNLGVAYRRAMQFDDAGRVVDDIVANHGNEISAYGWAVLLTTRGWVYESRSDHAASAADLRKALELARDDEDTHTRLRYLLALARTNNLERFEEGVAFCKKHPTESYQSRPYDVDALRAYLLVRNRDEVRAKAAVQKWRNDADAQKWFHYYWDEVHDASDVVDTWDRLTK